MRTVVPSVTDSVRDFALRPECLLAGSFAALIALGTILLSLTVCQTEENVSLLDAFFTSTSAVCVTGLTVVHTGTAYTRTGQTVILVLIQLGGLGIMTFAALAFALIGSRMSMRAASALQDVFFQTQAATKLRKTILWIVLLTLTIEAVGAIMMYPGFRRFHDAPDAVYAAVFHTVSAFCNAGFSTEADSLVAFRHDYFTLAVFVVLIYSGGLGYLVILEGLQRGRARLRRQLPDPLNRSLHSTVVLRTSLCLVVLGTVAMFFHSGMKHPEVAWLDRAVVAFFHSVSSRTAGFHVDDVGGIILSGLWCLMILMFIGGAPGSCAGGIKTTTFAVWAASLWQMLRGRNEPTLCGRRIHDDIVRRAFLIVGLAVAYNLVGVFVLSVTEAETSWTLERIMFEQVSAFGTVGLSTGITPDLSSAGKIWVIISMFLGRLGPLTIALVVVPRRPPAARDPVERVMIG
jgi:trk system potassium uptake protein TrkH